jgi:hypothetical protein
MKRNSITAMWLGVSLFAVGCGQSHDDRQATRDLRKLSNETAVDVNCEVQDTAHAAHDLTRAGEAVISNAESAVRQASYEVRDESRPQCDPATTANPAQLNREVKRDAVDAAGAAAEAEAEKLLKLK